ncbi:MAG: high-potential iron-sulfur protein [Acidobacteria bacterium]|nr:high-potential iron-sulfur protein [Acidobacteriota bacterium]
MKKETMNRRSFVKKSAVAVAGLGLASQVQAYVPLEDEKHVREYDSNKALIDTLKYVDKSEKADQNCGNCQFYTEAKEGMGKCTLIPKGLVTNTGYCISWAKKVS